jgi:hypothetical protein
MVPRASLDECGKSRRHQDSIPGPASPYRVAIASTLSWPTLLSEDKRKFK